jgi:hypothetical protein
MSRELLERALKGLENRRDEVANWVAYADEYLQKKCGYEYSISEFDGLMEKIRVYLDTPEPTQDEKPIAYWDTQEGKLIPAVPLSSERTCFEVPLVPLYIHPRADIVDELIKALIAIGAGQGDPKAVAIQALENYMEEK